jgi:hypothetical protein
MVQPLTDGSGRVFDPEKSVRKWEKIPTMDEVERQIRGEDNGREAGQRLYLTNDGTFVLCYWDTAYSHDTEYKEIEIEEAARWLASNGYHADLWNPALDMSHEGRMLNLDMPKRS